jgi:phage terminase large subunit GpA-like protein
MSIIASCRFAEQLVTKMVKGYPKREWQKIRNRNEALDCRVYARAAAIALGVEHWSDKKWEKIVGNVGAKITRPADISLPAGDVSQKSLSRQIRKRKSRSSIMG